MAQSDHKKQHLLYFLFNCYVKFFHCFKTRYVYTAWHVDAITFSNKMSMWDTWNATVLNSVNVSQSFPRTFSLDRPFIANSISFNLNISSQQRVPYFDLRGCDLEGKYFFDIFLYYLS